MFALKKRKKRKKKEKNETELCVVKCTQDKRYSSVTDHFRLDPKPLKKVLYAATSKMH